MLLLIKVYKKISTLYQTLKPAPVKKHSNHIQKIIKPGDIILLRNYFLERIWPGYFSHTGLYIGTVNKNKNQVLQIRAGGTELVSLKNFLTAKEAAILSPKITKSEISSAVKKAVRLKNRKYDFSFNFNNPKKLSCTELIYTVYKKPLRLKLKKFLWKRIFIADQTINSKFQLKWISSGAKKEYIKIKRTKSKKA